jgi:hypothetical protein
MPSPPPPGTPFWTINAADITGGSDGKKLAGCHIVQNPTYFTITAPDWTVLAQSTTIGLPTVAFQFPQFPLRDIEGWTVNMSAPPASTSSPWGADSWSFPPQPGHVKRGGSGQNGDFTAQAGSGLGEDEDAASATA